jgi:HD-GYP domain-containing protein (c-di-GMP phosphodiesterase class II)
MTRGSPSAKPGFPSSGDPPSDPGHEPNTDPASRTIRELEQSVASLAESELEHLRELALLNRLADLLSLRRGVEEVLEHGLKEARQIMDASRVWIAELDRDGGPVRWRCLGGEAADRPIEAEDMAERLIRERPVQPLATPGYAPEAECLYIGLPISGAQHLVGALICRCEDFAAATSAPRQRLLTSFAHQVGAGCESALLFEDLGKLVVDVVISFAEAIESRDPYTGGHSLRVTAYALAIGEAVGVSDREMSVLRLGGLLHDVGKVGVPDAVLRKPGKLSDEEFAIIQQHPAIGDRIIAHVPQLGLTRWIVRHHHERFDGRGYPDGLGGEEIDRLARITAVADTFDAMTSDRPYRKGLAPETAREEISRHAGTQFDPELAAAFVRLSDRRLAEAVEAQERWRTADRGADVQQLLDVLSAAASPESGKEAAA